MWFVQYDVRGIQAYIFAVPKLKYIVGGSAIIDEFDVETIPQLAGKHRIFMNAGGRGTIEVKDRDSGKELRDKICEAANGLGLDVRISVSKSLSDEPRELYAYVPEDLNGEPCSASGLWPVTGRGRGYQQDHYGIHDLIWKRVDYAKEDRVGGGLLEEAGLDPKRYEFIRQLDADDTGDVEEMARARSANAALQGKSRWAIIAMDGNDIGAQHKSSLTRFANDPSELNEWRKKMSGALSKATRAAVVKALGRQITAYLDWLKEDGDAAKACSYDLSGSPVTVLPFRPLIIGGDDILLICPTDRAIELARDISNAFTEQTKLADNSQLWLATGGSLTISAGIAYVHTKFPLHTAVDMAERLLKNAKAAYRAQDPDKPMIAAFDWEQLDEGMIDNPTDRRRRGLQFVDADLTSNGSQIEVKLTRRPWSFADLKTRTALIEELRSLPRSVSLGLLESLSQPFWKRCEFVTKLRSNHPSLFEQIKEPLPDGANSFGKSWTHNKSERSTYLLDCLLLAEEMPTMTVDSSQSGEST